MTQEEIAHLMGKTQSAVANKLRILRLSEGVKQVLTEYGLTERACAGASSAAGGREAAGCGAVYGAHEFNSKTG